MSNSSLIGKDHNAHLDWLLNTWMKSSSPVCFLEGFSGTGKTTIARELLTQTTQNKMTAVMITAPETEKDPTDDLLLDLAMELNSAGRNELVEAIENNRSLVDVLASLIEDPILIIIDEFQHSMQGSRSITRGGFAKVLSVLANRKWLKGRILLLSNRIIERARWSEPYAIRTLKGMSTDDGVTLLKHFAREGDRTDEILPERQADIVNWLGGNPRAIRLLVRSLSYDSLDDLIGIKPELWEMRDRTVSPELVEELERSLLEKTLEQLTDEYALALYRLSAHRKPFKRQAIEHLFQTKSEYARFKSEIIDRFLMEQYRSWFSLHPIVREISLQKFTQSPEQLQQTHSIVSTYYTRHFQAKQIVGWGALGGHFVEARYHLIKAGQEDTLKDIAQRFQSYVFSTLSRSSPIPQNAEELDERIAVLSALLETPGPRGLEYHLARLFYTRNQRNDLRRALHHVNRAKRRSDLAEVWLLCSEILHQMGRIFEAIDVLEQGIEYVPSDKGLVAIYVRFARLLTEQGNIPEVVNILKKGIERIPPDKAAVSLYEQLARTLTDAERQNEAIEVLRQGIKRIPSDKSLFMLYLAYGDILGSMGEYSEAISILQDGINRIPPEQGTSSLYLHCSDYMFRLKQWDDAFELLQDGANCLVNHKSVTTIRLQYAKLLIASGQCNKAIEILVNGIRHTFTKPDHLVEALIMFYAICRDEQGLAQLDKLTRGIKEKHSILAQTLLYQVQERWLDAAEHACQKRKGGIEYSLLSIIEAFSWLCVYEIEYALDALSNVKDSSNDPQVAWLYTFIFLKMDTFNNKEGATDYNHVGNPIQNADEAALLTMWEQPSTSLREWDLAYYFPVLPPELTGLSQPLRRMAYQKSTSVRRPERKKTFFSATNEEEMEDKPIRNKVFISYSHEDKRWLGYLKTHMASLIDDNRLDVWDDTQIEMGDNWRTEIEMALAQTKIAVLLVSPHFLQSRFIRENELPPLLTAAESEGVTIAWISISSSMYKETAIGDYQCANDPSSPLDSMSVSKRNTTLVQICEKILKASN